MISQASANVARTAATARTPVDASISGTADAVAVPDEDPPELDEPPPDQL